VLDGGGVLLYSDFHPEAARAGLKRSFKAELRGSHTLPHHAHPVESQTQAAGRAGLDVEAVEEIRVGIEMQERFPGCERFYRRWHGLPLVLVVRARKR
jgi:malonyl-CoA O-methyltransferase